MLDALEIAGPSLEQARAKLETTRAALQALLDTVAVECDEMEQVRQAVTKLERLAAELE